MTADSLIDPESAAKIGTVVAVATGEVYRRDWQRWAAAVGDHNPLWFDPDYARQHGYRDIVCPPLYLQYAILGVTALGGPAAGRVLRCGVRQHGVSARTAADGRRREHDVSPARLPPRRDRDGAHRRLDRRKGRQIRRFVLVTWRSEYRNQHRELVAEATTSMIARPA